ncbi:MAG: type II toxin-antitoxin system Phd/YefM family antitoxin [Kiritimatiellae bacterium]|jgi:prevent-host-death family protein|nr:type II toxin-antitoxin system Phd/YefM family antitoxin [Kiritimatiellia bacterium]
MPVIVPVRDLKDTNKISELCNREKRPVFITKNGYGDMVIMSMAYYEETMGRNAVYAKLEEARADVAAGRVKPLNKAIAKQRAKLNVRA